MTNVVDISSRRGVKVQPWERKLQRYLDAAAEDIVDHVGEQLNITMSPEAVDNLRRLVASKLVLHL